MIGVISKCFNCKNKTNLYTSTPTCKAFPNGIPDEIYFGENDHSKPLPNQKNDITFEPIKQSK